MSDFIVRSRRVHGANFSRIFCHCISFRLIFNIDLVPYRNLIQRKNPAPPSTPVPGAAPSTSAPSTPQQQPSPQSMPIPQPSKYFSSFHKFIKNIKRTSFHSNSSACPAGADVCNSSTATATCLTFRSLHKVNIFNLEYTPRVLTVFCFANRYIEGLQSNASYISPYEKTIRTTQATAPTVDVSKLPVQWLGQHAQDKPEEVVNALWHLRNFMLKDVLEIKRQCF